MIVKSIRFGQFEIPDNKIIIMEKPVLGFENLRKYCLVEIEEMSPLLWFQSIEDTAISFLVVNPRVFFPDYKIEVNSKEIAELNIKQVKAVETYAIVTLPNNPEEITINLQGPILINTENNLAKQLVLVNSKYHVKHRIMNVIPSSSKETHTIKKQLVEI